MKRNYTPKEVFEIFKEEHRLCSPLDVMADPTFDLKFDTKIWKWRVIRDLVEWEELSNFLNQQFRIKIPKPEWRNVFEPDEKMTIGDVCGLISQYAIKDEVGPIKIMGAKCLSASIFITLKKNLKSKGADVSCLKPSSNISPYLEKFFSPMIEEICLLGVGIFEKLEYKNVGYEREIKCVWDKLFPRYRMISEFDTGDIITFRDLVTQIIKNRDSQLGSLP